MYLTKVYDPADRAYRVRYASANILRDRVANEGAFHCCFEMGDEDEVVCAILRPGAEESKAACCAREQPSSELHPMAGSLSRARRSILHERNPGPEPETA